MPQARLIDLDRYRAERQARRTIRHLRLSPADRL